MCIYACVYIYTLIFIYMDYRAVQLIQGALAALSGSPRNTMDDPTCTCKCQLYICTYTLIYMCRSAYTYICIALNVYIYASVSTPHVSIDVQARVINVSEGQQAGARIDGAHRKAWLWTIEPGINRSTNNKPLVLLWSVHICTYVHAGLLSL